MERFQVEIATFPGDEIRFVAALRTVGVMSLADAADLYRHATTANHTVLVAGIERAVADHIAATFEAAGTDVVVNPSSLSTPMVGRPKANVAYRWNAARWVVEVPDPST